MGLKRWSVAGAACLVGIVGVGVGAAGASSLKIPAPGSSAALAPSGFKVGTDDFVVNGEVATITFSANYTWTSNIGGDDGGQWVIGGKSIALSLTTGSDAQGNCVLAGTVTGKNSIGSARSPGKYSCAASGTKGVWYVAPQSAETPATAAAVVPAAFSKGTYSLHTADENAGVITFSGHATFTSAIDGGDSGTWTNAGAAFAFAIEGGDPGDIGCLFVGTVTASGGGISSKADPGPYVCPGQGIVSVWWADKS